MGKVLCVASVKKSPLLLFSSSCRKENGRFDLLVMGEEKGAFEFRFLFDELLD